MSSRSPVFPITEPQHFSDYGFDPQIDYFQVLEEARKHKRDSSSRSIDTLHFKLPKPNLRDEPSKKIKKNKKRWWWKNALHFFKRKLALPEKPHNSDDLDYARGPHHGRSPGGRGSISVPVYITESRSGSTTPYITTTSRPSSGPLAGTLTPSGKGDVEIPYISLREINMDHHQQQQQRMSTSAVPIYLVT